jgi:hypothetical protein
LAACHPNWFALPQGWLFFPASGLFAAAVASRRKAAENRNERNKPMAAKVARP